PQPPSPRPPTNYHTDDDHADHLCVGNVEHRDQPPQSPVHQYRSTRAATTY
ncbi:hypothetical protein I552_7534, partial [Mycobacterium xenopi 3993]